MKALHLLRLDPQGMGFIDPEQAIALLLGQVKTTRGGNAVVPLAFKASAKMAGTRLVILVGAEVRAIARIFQPESPSHFGADLRKAWLDAGVPPHRVKGWMVVHRVQALQGITAADLVRVDGVPLGDKIRAERTFRAVRFLPGKEPDPAPG